MKALPRPLRIPGPPLRAVVCTVACASWLGAQELPPRAVPIEDPAPRAEPIAEEEEAEAAPPAPAPERTPAPPPATPAPAAQETPATPRPADPPAPAQESRPGDDLFDYSEMLFSKQEYSLALRQYGEYARLFPQGRHIAEVRFKIAECHYRSRDFARALAEFDGWLRDFPRSRNRPIALYHAGECHRELASRVRPDQRDREIELAQDAYRAALREAGSGPYACYAAFRLASFAYNGAVADPARYREAIRYFETAARMAPQDQPKIRFDALFFRGRALKYSGDAKGAAAAFEEVIRTKDGNERYEQAMMELATLDIEGGRQESAMKRFELLARESAAAETRAESLVNSGMIHAENGRTEEAIARFEEALSIPTAVRSASRARFGLVFAYSRTKQWQKVVDTWRNMTDHGSLDEPTRARMLLIVGTAYAATDQHARAIEVFRILEENIPWREESLEGGYKRLVSLFRLNDPAVTGETDSFIARWKQARPDSPFIDKALLVKAAWYFNRRVWDLAAQAYAAVRPSKLEEERIPTYLYQRGCAEASGSDSRAAGTLTEFLNRFPDDPRAPMAVMQRGLAYLRAGDLANSLKDFETIIEKHPDSEPVESALYHAAKVRGMNQDYEGMVAGFRRLLERFPSTLVAAEAHYWIGTGLFQQKKYDECLEPLRVARSRNAKEYGTDASLMIIGALTEKKDVDALIEEVNAYLDGAHEKKIQPEILRWLGVTLFADRRDYTRAARYLAEIADTREPANTDSLVWRTLGECLLETGSYESAITALDNHLAVDDYPPRRERSYWLKGRALFALNRTAEAIACAEEGLRSNLEINQRTAQLRILIGDIAAREGRINEAVSSYLAVKVSLEDPAITPLVIWKMAEVLSSSKSPEDRRKVESLREELKRYPSFQPPDL